MKSSLLALVATTGAALFATSAVAQTADPVGPGTLIVSGRLTVVSSDANDPILTSAGVATGRSHFTGMPSSRDQNSYLKVAWMAHCDSPLFCLTE